MKSRYSFLSVLFVLLLCSPFATLLAAPAPKPPNLDARVATLEALVATLQLELAAAQSDLAAQSALLAGVSRLNDPNTGQDTFRFEDMNVQIVNGAGTTYSVTGTGNLIIGYNEFRRNPQDCYPPVDCGNWRSGSHNLVGGSGNNYTSFGGAVVGIFNETSGPFASISGGALNTSSGLFSSISGGDFNIANAEGTSISGGSHNTASFLYSSVSGGQWNTATGARGSSVSGGAYNIASGENSSVSGGELRTADLESNWAAGSLFESN